jgi:peptide deformylase
MLHTINIVGLPFLNEKGQLFYPTNFSQIPAKEFLKTKRLLKEVTPAEYEVEGDEWARLQQENAWVRTYEGGKKIVFINAQITELTGAPWICDEGCLSLPGFREEVSRESTLTIEYVDENFQLKIEKYKGLNARVILHEYDHIQGKLFIDRISPFRKKLLKKKLDDISAGRVKAGYKMLLPK